MSIYLPIAGLSLDVFLLLLVGGGVGFLSGLFGIGGGFLITPLLIFLGVPSPVAVATGANQVIGASVSGVIAHWRRRNVDFKMGVVLVIGGLIGGTPGVWMFARLHALGQVDQVVALAYVLFLGLVGCLMLAESLRASLRARRPAVRRNKRHHHRWAWLPLKVRFERSGLYISVLLPLGVGIVGGMMSAIMGVGGGFILVPLMIYLLEMPTLVVVGTSLFQVIFVTANVTFLQAVTTQSVDIVLMLTLVIGGVVGAQLGARFDARLKPEHMRLLLALLLLAVCGRLVYELFAQPDDLFGLATPLVR